MPKIFDRHRQTSLIGFTVPPAGRRLRDSPGLNLRRNGRAVLAVLGGGRTPHPKLSLHSVIFFFSGQKPL